MQVRPARSPVADRRRPRGVPRRAPGPPRPPGPPPPPGPPTAGDSKTIKKVPQPTYKMPTVHWLPLKPNDTKDTIWYLMDDEKLMKDLDLSAFEEEFKLNTGPIRPRKKPG